MTDASYPHSERDFKAALGDFIVSWNSLDWTARYLLEKLAGLESYAGQIVTAKIEGTQLAKALSGVAELQDDLCKEHVRHFSKGFDNIRETRNYLVHSIKIIALVDGAAVGIANDIKVSDTLKYRQAPVTLSDISAARQSVADFHIYGSAITGHVFKQNDLALFAFQPLEAIEKPQIPTSLASEHPFLPVR